MIWIRNKDYPHMRGDIETYNQFVKRNIAWWKENERFERSRRLKYYNHFIDYCKLNSVFSVTRNIAEVGPGPFGGILEVCKVPSRRKYFIDYMMKELVNLKFIEWPDYATYVHAPAEKIPLGDDTVDILVSYNALDHGWDVWAAIKECVRISQRCFLCFDCRGDSEKEVEKRKEMKDLDHHQSIKFSEVKEFMENNYGRCTHQVTDLGTKPEWGVAVVIMEK